VDRAHGMSWLARRFIESFIMGMPRPHRQRQLFFTIAFGGECCRFVSGKGAMSGLMCRVGVKLIKAAGPGGGAGPRCADLCRPGETGAVAWGLAGRRQAIGLPGAAEVRLVLGARRGGKFRQWP